MARCTKGSVPSTSPFRKRAVAAKYQLADKEGGKGPELKSAPVKITVTEK